MHDDNERKIFRHNDAFDRLSYDSKAMADINARANKIAARSVFMTDEELLDALDEHQEYLLQRYGIPKLPLDESGQRQAILDFRQSFQAVMAAREVLYNGAPGELTKDALRDLPPQSYDVVRYNEWNRNSSAENREIDVTQLGKFGLLEMDYTHLSETDLEKIDKQYEDLSSSRVLRRSFSTINQRRASRKLP